MLNEALTKAWRDHPETRPRDPRLAEQQFRNLQGIRADLQFTVPPDYRGEDQFEGGGIYMGETKTMHSAGLYDESAGVKHGRIKAVDVKEQKLPGQYLQKAREKDQLWFPEQTGEGRRGPLEACVASYSMAGFVFGHMGEASRGVREFLNMCADVGSREESIARTVGATSQEAVKSTLIRRFRQKIGLTAWRGTADLLLNRIQYLGVPDRPRTKAQRKAALARAWEVDDLDMTNAAQIIGQGPIHHAGGD